MRAPRLFALAACCALSTACGVEVFDPGPPPEPETPAPLSIVGPRADLVFTRADDEDPRTDGIQTTLRVDVTDAAIERVDLTVSTPAGEIALDDVVAEDFDGVRCARFVVTLGAAPETPVRATTPDVRPDAIQDARVTLVLAPE